MKILKSTLQCIEPLNKESIKNAWKRLDSLTKPIGSLGEIENIIAKMAGITGKVHNKINKKNVVIMCGDNGVVEEGVSNCPKSVTATVTNNFTKDITGVYVLSKFAGSDITVVDVGVDVDFNNPKIVNKKIAYGTMNMMKGPAMSLIRMMLLMCFQKLEDSILQDYVVVFYQLRKIECLLLSMALYPQQLLCVLIN